ncbi:hypothetical protein VTO42DRAFT_1803 [Malbranchea cinnamomea]
MDTTYRGTLGTAGKSTRIEGMGTIRLPMGDGITARLGGVKYVPGMRGTLLSTQALSVNGIYNQHGRNGYKFYRETGTGQKEVIARGIDEGLASYLSWVRSPDALLTDPIKTRQLRYGTSKANLVANKQCETCIQATKVKIQNRDPISRASRILERGYIDFLGPVRPGESAWRNPIFPLNYRLQITEIMDLFDQG